MKKFFAIGAYTYININLIEEVYTDEKAVVMHDGTKHTFNNELFNELLEVLNPFMFGGESEFNAL